MRLSVPLNQIAELFSEHSRKIATGISVVLVVLMSLSVANTVLFVLEKLNPPSVIPSSKPVNITAGKKTFKVSNLELFGKAAETDTIQEVIDAPETNLNLELQGVFIAEEDARSTAIVGEKNKAGELYAVGDKLPGNATLAAVYEDHVLLKRGARMEKLLFSDSKFRSVVADNRPADQASTSASTGLSDSRKANLKRVRDRMRNQAPGATSQSATQSDTTKTRLTEYRDKLRNNPQGTLSEVGLAPVSEGDAKGYRVGSDAQAAIKQAGLQPGDVVLSVNGRPVGVAATDSALMEQVMASSRVRVEVQRGSRRFFLTVPVPK